MAAGDPAACVTCRAYTGRCRTMRCLQFVGTMSSTRDTETMALPGRHELLVAPADWPTRFAPGTLGINVTGLPDDLAAVGQGEGLTKLDQGSFRAALVIPQRKIVGNPVPPEPDHPTRGFAQVWRTELRTLYAGQAADCWMVQIIGSGSESHLELMAEERLHDHLGLSEGAPVKATVWEAEPLGKLPTPNEMIADWCEAARGVEMEFGPQQTMGYLIGEKFLNFLEVVETKDGWRGTIPSFVTEVQSLFEPWQLAGFLNTPRRLGVLGHTADDEGHRLLREALDDSQRAQEDARNLLLVEWAKELLLGEPDV